MSVALVLLPLLLHVAPGYRYWPYELHELALLADRVVVGEIVALQESTFDLFVERTLVGVPEDRLRIERFVDWACAARWTPYREGQRVLLFLVGDQVMGAGNEGEMPLAGDGALMHYRVRGSRFVERSAQGGGIRASWVPLAEIAHALEALRATLAVETDDRRRIVSVRPRAGSVALDELSQASGFGHELVDDLTSCKCWRGPARPMELALDASWTPDLGSNLSSTPKHLLVRRLDGRDDWLAAIPGAVLRLPSHGSAHERFVPTDDLAPGDPRVFGSALASVSGFHRDGRADIAISITRRYDHIRCEEAHAASLRFYSWEPGGAARRTGALEGSEDPRLIDGCRFGRALVGVGDLDRDGVSELAVARTTDREWSTGGWTAAAGSLALLFLDRDRTVRRWTSIAPADVGHDSPAEFASVLAAPGDVDGDSVPDLVLGEPLDCAEGAYRGVLRVLFLTADGRVRGWTRIGTEAFGLADGDELGVALAAVGDIDDDGMPDLVAAGVDALWSVRLARDGSARAVRHFALAELQPGAVEVVALAAHANGARADGTVRLLMSARGGTAKPFDVGLDWLAVSGSGEIRQD